MTISEHYRKRDALRLRKQKQEEQFKTNSAERLKTIIGKKYLTVAVGALSSFEEEFGHLWGHGLDEDKLTDEQLRNREKWDRARTEILDRGNANKRACFDEISNYTISWNRHTTTFTIGRKGNV